MLEKSSIYDLTEQDLLAWLKEQGIAAFRTMQIWQWLYKKRATDFSLMHDLCKETRALLGEHFVLSTLQEVSLQISKSGTLKGLFQLQDGHLIETVLMSHSYGLSVCISTQVGCNLGCSFCASGLLSKKRDLTAGEMVEQVLCMQKKLDGQVGGKKVTHIVVMGIGEPFDNYDQLLRFIQIVNHPKGLAIGARRITVSTCGIVSKIRNFADEKLQVNLALSLHAANNALRTQLMKVNKAMPIEVLMEAIDYYLQKTRRKVTFEYLLLKGINDHESCAFDLCNLIFARELRHLIYVNLIPYNGVEQLASYQRSERQAINHFVDVLRQQGINVVIRKSHGGDIQAACGQLRSLPLSTKAV